MATRKSVKTTSKRSTRTAKAIPVEMTEAVQSTTTPITNYYSTLSQRNKNLVILLSVLLLALIAVFFLKRNWLIAAQVDGSYISNIELQTRLNTQYRKSLLSEMIDEKIIQNEAKKKGVSVSSSEVDAKVSDYETQFGGPEQFDAALEQKGLNRDTVKYRVMTELLLDKMYGGEVSVSAQEIDDYIKVNKAILQATEPGAQRAEAEKNIRDQKLFSVVSEKFQQLKEAAKVSIF